MISFAQPIFFWLLPLAPLPLVWRVWTHVRGRSAVPLPTLHDRVAVVPSFWSRLWWLPALLRSTAIALAKRSFNMDTEHHRGISGLGMLGLSLYYDTDESKEGGLAFKEKRKPDFRKFSR